MNRQTDLDWLRGLMLVLMTITHLPTWFGAHVGQPFGYVSAAEGFVFLSAFLVGSVYTRVAERQGITAMRRALVKRTLKVYAVHVALLLFLFYVLVPIAAARGAHGITDLASFYIEHPHTALAGGLLLAYNPPLLDILPMYVLFLAVSPFVLEHAQRRGFAGLLVPSAALWLFAQHGGGRQVYESLGATVGWPVPYSQTGAFSLLAWQLLWLVGLRAGALQAAVRDTTKADHRWPRFLVRTAVLIAAALLVWRHLAGQLPFSADSTLNALFDKWHLGPLRLLNFAALAILVVHARPLLVAWSRNSTIATLGRASLTVFSGHLVLCLALLTIVGQSIAPHAGLLDAGLVAGSLVTLYGVARASLGSARLLRSHGAPVRVRVPGAR